MHFIDVFHIFVNALVRIFRNTDECNVHEALARMRGIFDRLERGPTNNTGSYDTSLSYN